MKEERSDLSNCWFEVAVALAVKVNKFVVFKQERVQAKGTFPLVHETWFYGWIHDQNDLGEGWGKVWKTEARSLQYCTVTPSQFC